MDAKGLIQKRRKRRCAQSQEVRILQQAIGNDENGVEKESDGVGTERGRGNLETVLGGALA